MQQFNCFLVKHDGGMKNGGVIRYEGETVSAAEMKVLLGTDGERYGFRRSQGRIYLNNASVDETHFKELEVVELETYVGAEVTSQTELDQQGTPQQGTPQPAKPKRKKRVTNEESNKNTTIRKESSN